jgi:hypothetical protein
LVFIPKTIRHKLRLSFAFGGLMKFFPLFDFNSFVKSKQANMKVKGKSQGAKD